MPWNDGEDGRFNDYGIWVPEPSGRVSDDTYYGNRDEVSSGLGCSSFDSTESMKRKRMRYVEDSITNKDPNRLDIESLLWNMDVPDGCICVRIVINDGKVVPTFTPLEKIPPKPLSLIGCSEPSFRKDGFWSCKREKDGSSYTWIHTEDLTKSFFERSVITSMEQDSARCNIIQAIESKPDAGGFWVTTYEPSFSSKRKNLQSVKNANPSFRLENTNLDWDKLAKKFDLVNGSKLLSKDGYFLVLARWIKDGIAKWSEIADDSSKIGNYKKFESYIEMTGARYFGGLFGFVGNTYKILRNTGKGNITPYLSIGGTYYCNANTFHATAVFWCSYECRVRFHYTGWIELSNK